MSMMSRRMECRPFFCSPAGAGRWGMMGHYYATDSAAVTIGTLCVRERRWCRRRPRQ